MKSGDIDAVPDDKVHIHFGFNDMALYLRGEGRGPETELKGSIGEGPNHSNHSNRSNSFKIGIFTSKLKDFRKFQH